MSATTSASHSLLTLPSQRGALAALRALLDAGADANVLAATPRRRQLRTEQSALENACAHGHADAVRALLDAGASAATSPRALSHAASVGRADIVAMLLDAGAGAVLNTANTGPEGSVLERKTPLMIACYDNQPATAETLLAAGSRATIVVPPPAPLAGGDVDDPFAAATPMACALRGRVGRYNQFARRARRARAGAQRGATRCLRRRPGQDVCAARRCRKPALRHV